MLARWFLVFTLVCSVCALARAVSPADWSNTDIGTVGVAGSGSYHSGTGVYTLQGSGADIGSTSDHFHYSYQSLSGDGVIIARVNSLTDTSASAKAGVMIRETLTSTSKHALMMVTPGAGIGFKSRSTAGGTATSVLTTGLAAPQWLKLERRGSVFSGYHSADGVAWTLSHRIAIAMTADVYVGLFACSRSASALTTAAVDNIVVDTTAAALPWPWEEITVGAPTDAGVALFDGSYVLANLGADIASTADKFKFVSRSLTGDGTLTVKISSLTSGTTAPRFGLMMRGGLQANAANALIGLTTPQDLVFQSRRTPGASTGSRAAALTVSYPTWLKLERSGNAFTASYSTNGTTWTQQGGVETIDLPPTIQVGVAYSNRSTGTWGIGVGDDLRLTTAADTDGNGLPDAWETAHFGATGVDLLADPDADGLSNYQEWELGNNPGVANASGQHPVLELVSGDLQSATAGAILPQALGVRVKDSLSGDPLAGVPVTFTVVNALGRVGSTDTWQTSVTLVSDPNGWVQTQFKLPVRAGSHRVQAVIGAGLAAGRVEFTLKALAGEGALILEPSDVGAPLQPGRTDYAAGTYTLGGAGTALSGAADTGHFAWKTQDGDGYVLARVGAFDAVGSESRAGIMMRASLDANARYAAVFVSPGLGVIFQARGAVGGASSYVSQTGAAPRWLLLRRSGNTLAAFYSGDGVTWQSVGATRTVAMGATVCAGVAVSTPDSAYRSAVFDHVRLAPLTESPWLAADIGTANLTVVDDYAGANSILVRGGGANITATSDSFRYVYQPLPSDGRLTVRLNGQLSGQTTAKSGIMLRAGTGANARNLFLGATPTGPVRLQQRAAANDTTTTLASQTLATPRWLRLVKLGSQVDAFVSADGDAWSLLTSVTQDFSSTMLGLAAHSTSTTAHTQTLFDHIQLESFAGARGWNAAYYDGAAFNTLRLRRRDASVDHAWSAGTAPATGVSAAAYSIRWEADLVPAYGETYTFKSLSQGGLRVLVNGVAVIDQWTPHASAEHTGELALTAGTPVRIVVEYANAAGDSTDARVRLAWSSASQSEETIGTDALCPLDTDIDGMSDAWETAHGFNPLNPADAALDPDSDGLTNLQEYQLNGDPSAAQDRLAGAVVLEQWNSVAGTTVRELTAKADFFTAPDSKQALTRLAAPSNRGNTLGSRIRGYIVPPADGAYQFWLSADDTAEFWLSPDDNPLNRVQVARVTFVNPQLTPGSYDGRFEQRSATVTLQAGQAYYFEVLHKENTTNDQVSVAWARPGVARAVIPGACLATYAPPATDADDDGLPDTWQATHGLNASLAPAARGAYGDADSDGLINLLEYRAGTHPAVADTDGDGYSDHLETLVQSNPLAATDLNLSPWTYGDVGEVYGPALAYRTAPNAYRLASVGWGTQVHFDDAIRFLHQEVTGDFELTARIARPDSSIVGEGLITVRASLAEDAPAVVLTVRPDGQHVAFVRSTPTGGVVTLAEFYPAHVSETATRDGYWVRLKREGNLFKYFYSADGTHWTLFTLTTLSLEPGCVAGFAAANGGDELAVRQFTGVNLNTAPAPAPDPDTLPSGVTGTVIATIHGSAGVPVVGQWTVDGDGLVSKLFTGTLDYTFTVPADGVYRLGFSTRSPVNPTVSTLFPVELSVDGQPVARVNLILPAGEDGLAQIVTPWLKAGTHTVRLFWDNTLSYRKLRINALTVEALSGGADTDSNGRPDWLDARLNGLNTVAVSDRDLFVSPVSLDGKARFRGLLQLTADAVPVTVNPAPGFGWYADVPLSETAPVEIRAAFENDGRVETTSLAWTAVNLLALPEFAASGQIKVRKGDSLRFTAWPAAATGGSAVVNILAPGETTPVAHAVTAPHTAAITQAFTTPGVYTITATYTDAASATTAADAFTVEVIEAAFASNPTVGLNNTAITWDNPLIPLSSVLVEVDQGLVLSALSTLPAGGTRFSLSTVNLADSYVVARLGEDGPIFGHAVVKSTRAATVSDTAMDLLHSYSDGSKLYGVPIIVNNLTDNTRVEIEIFVAGVTFEDGTLRRTLTKGDFDQYGRFYAKFLYPAGVTTSICHRIHIYEGDTYLGQF